MSVAGGRIFTSGYYAGNDFATALDEKTGRQLWAAYLCTSIPETGIHTLMRWLSQRAPTVDGDRVYYVTSSGNLVCVNSASGRLIWRKNYPKDFDSRLPGWTYCDCPLVDGDRLICLPGGTNAAIVALNKYTGHVIWRSAAGDGLAGYSPLVAAEIHGIKQYVACLGRGGLTGFAAKDGKVLWQYPQVASGANSHAPIVRGDQIFYTNGYGGGMALLRLVSTSDGLRVEEQYYRKERFASIQDSSVPVAVGDYAYDFRAPGGLVCIEIKSGEVVWQSRTQPPPSAAAGKGRGSGLAGGVIQRGSLTYAEGRLYVRDMTGTVALVAASPDGYQEKGSFKVPDHPAALNGATAPVLANGRLYLREDEVLYCYDVRAASAGKPRAEAVRVALPPFPPPDVATASNQPRPDGKKRDPDALYVPTPHDVVEKMLELAKITKKDLVYDLGSGDGCIVLAAAKEYGCKAVGYEIDPELVKSSRDEIRRCQLQELVQIVQEDFFTTDLSKADVIAVYLPPRILERLLPQFTKLKPGARIVSHYFEIPGYKSEKSVTVDSKDDGGRHQLYLWTAPLQKIK
jgi:outer membrane protein assembly factor BamB